VGYHSRQRQRAGRQTGVVELVCVALVLIAIAALVVFIVTNAGGGVLMN